MVQRHAREPLTRSVADGMRSANAGTPYRGADRDPQDAAHFSRRSTIFQEGLAVRCPTKFGRLRLAAPSLGADIHKNRPNRGAPPGAREEAGSRRRGSPGCTHRRYDTVGASGPLRTPPHILVTTPESLYLLLTAERSRESSARRGL